MYSKYTEVITDHKPLPPIYTSPRKPKQHRVDRHRTKLLSHEEHQCTNKTLRLLRQACWFPIIRKQVHDFAALPSPAMQPSHIHTMFPCNLTSCLISPGRKYMLTLKGPWGNYYLHAVIDHCSKFPEVDLLHSTSFRKLRYILHGIFSTHGIPESLTTGNGPPYSSHEMTEYAKEVGLNLSPVGPQCNGFAEKGYKQNYHISSEAMKQMSKKKLRTFMTRRS